MKIPKIVELARKRGLDSKDLEREVTDATQHIASQANLAGMTAQVKVLVQLLGEARTLRVLDTLVPGGRSDTDDVDIEYV